MTVIVKNINSLGFEKSVKNTKIVVAMSGGVDSSTVAGMIKKEGYDVIGVTLKLYDDIKTSKKGRQCCAGQDIVDAKRVSQELNIEHKILYYQKRFKTDVIDSFIDSYVAGETPIPCVQCNQTVKFRDLYTYSKKLGADALVTGHYVDRIQKNGNTEMYRAKDLERDQSYFLFNTTKNQLKFLRFPLGKMRKKETRDIALKLNLNVADKPDSQDICFVPNGNYASAINKFRPETFKKGNIVDMDGKIIGEHDGIINFTIGQRKGIKISSDCPLYVIRLDAIKNEVTVGRKEFLLIKKINLRNVNILDKIENNDNLFVKVRSTGRLIRSKIKKLDNEKAEVLLLEKETGVSPGQACVFYSKNKIGDKVLGGGWISSTECNN